MSIQAQVLELLGTIRREVGIGFLFVTHDLAVVRHITDEVMVLREGQVVEAGPTAEILDAPHHPYTRLLLSSVPRHRWNPTDAAAARRSLG